MVKFSGTNFVSEDKGLVVDPVAGVSQKYQYQGTKEAIYSLIPMLEANYAKCDITHDGPLWTCVAQYDYGEEPVDKWSLQTEVVQNDLFQLPKVQKEMVNWDAAHKLGDYRLKIEDLKTDLPVMMAALPYAYYVRFELLRGMAHYDDEMLVLKRTRTINPLLDDLMKLGLKMNRMVYTTKQLGLPDDVLVVIPDPPEDLPFAKWGWRLRTQQTEYTYTRGIIRVEQVTDFIFASWSSLVYEMSTKDFEG